MNAVDRDLPFSVRWESNLARRPLFFLETALFGAASLTASLWDKQGRLQHRIARSWARLSLWTAGASVTVTGHENIRPLAIYAANHVSFMDPPVAFGYLPFQFRIFAKENLWRWPFIGWHLRRSGQIPVSEGGSIAGVLRALRVLRSGMPLVIFPEGGRSRNGELQPFMNGPAILAIRAGVPLIPVGLAGTHELLPMGSSHFRPAHVRMSIGEPIDSTGFTIHQAAELTGRLRDAVSRLCGSGEAAPAMVSQPSTRLGQNQRRCTPEPRRSS